MLRNRVVIALLAAGLAFAFQALTVRYNYGGDWTGLFCVGDRSPQPSEIARPYQFRNSWGYDGQAYRLIAHDPFVRRGFDRYLDDPRYRYSRILVPMLAWALALGNDKWVDSAYILLVLGFVFAGAYWLAMLAERFGFPPWCGVLFLFAPATLVGMDRLTIDVALAALCVAFVALRPGSVGWLVALACAALCRETGLLLIGAACVPQVGRTPWSAGRPPGRPFYRITENALVERRFRSFLITASTAAPAVAWLVWVASRLPASPTARTGFIPLSGYVTRLAHPFEYPFGPLITGITQVLDYGALAGVAVALWCLWKLRWRPELLACAIPVLFVNLPDVWSEVYAFGRTMTPFWLLIAIRGVESRLWIALAPIALMDLRIGWQLGSQVLGIVRGLVT